MRQDLQWERDLRQLSHGPVRRRVLQRRRAISGGQLRGRHVSDPDGDGLRSLCVRHLGLQDHLRLGQRLRDGLLLQRFLLYGAKKLRRRLHGAGPVPVEHLLDRVLLWGDLHAGKPVRCELVQLERSVRVSDDPV